MDLDIRKAVLANLNDSTWDDVSKTITDAVNTQEEKVLPGLGVMFEVFWKSCNDNEKNQVVSKLVAALS